MTGLVRKALLLSAVGLAAASAAMAAVPNVANSTKPTWIDVVGYTNPPDPGGLITYVIRDGANGTIPNAEVVIDFSACTDISLCTTITTVVPSGSFVCATKRWTGTANALGVVTFTIVGGGNNNGAVARAIAACATVSVNGSSGWPALPVSAFDHSGSGGVGGGDLSIFGADFTAQLGGTYRARSDYSHDGTVGGGDLSIFGVKFAQALGGTGSVLSCGLVAPNNCP